MFLHGKTQITAQFSLFRGDTHWFMFPDGGGRGVPSNSYNDSRLILSSLSSPAWKEISIWRYVSAFLQAASLKSSLGTKGRVTSCWKCFSVAYLSHISQLATWILKLVFCNPLAHILSFSYLMLNSPTACLPNWPNESIRVALYLCGITEIQLLLCDLFSIAYENHFFKGSHFLHDCFILFCGRKLCGYTGI